jgi:ATP-dependent Zn protease
LPFQATVFGHKGEKLYSGEYFWNFGDGGSGKMDAFNTQPFSHTYYYPGNYVVSLDYYQTFYTDDSTPDASSQVNIKIIPESISISNVGDANDFFIEITNNTNDSADLSNWVLVSAQKGFKIPRNTIVASKQKIILSPKITNFSIEDENTLKLLDSQGNLIFDYSSPPVNQPDQISLSGTKPIKTTRTKNQDFTQQEIPTNNLTASAVSSDVANNNSTSNFATIIFIIFLIFIGVMAYAVYFVRHKKMIPDETGSDFEILDE